MIENKTLKDLGTLKTRRNKKKMYKSLYIHIQTYFTFLLFTSLASFDPSSFYISLTL